MFLGFRWPKKSNVVEDFKTVSQTIFLLLKAFDFCYKLFK
jgi:hypothetical protein